MGFPIKYDKQDVLVGYERYPGLSGIESKTISILQGIPTDQAVSLALATSREMPLSNPPIYGENNTHIPEVVIFSREGENPENVWSKLLTAIKTPDYDTPSYDQEVRPIIDALKSALFESGYVDGPLGAIAGGHMIRVAGGDNSAINWGYRDMARRYPQYSGEWHETLVRQFNGQLLPEKSGSQVQQNLVNILEGTIQIAIEHDKLHIRTIHGESTVEYTARQLEEAGEIFDIGSVDGLNRATAVLDRQFIDFRRRVYALRDIPCEP